MQLKVDRIICATPVEKRVPGYRIAGSVAYLAIVASIVAAATAAARPTQGYGSLIDGYCISRNRLRVAGHQPHCAMCHQSGTFDNLPAHRVEPNWTEFERGRTSGDFSFFCPGDASGVPASPAATPSQSATPQPNPSAAGNPAPAAPLPSPSPMPVRPGPSMAGEMGMGPMRGHEREGGERGGMGPTGNMGQGPPVTSPAPTPADPAAVPSPAATQQGMATPTIDRPVLMPADLEQHLSHFRDDVGIGEAQRPGWDAFAEAVRSAAGRRREIANAALPSSTPSGDALTLMQLQERRLSARIAALRYVSTAFTRLLAVLDENQRKKANERFSPLLDAL